jgi:dipeptidyl aminopeptidase/acylaminoacyl peptidase
MMKLKHFLFTSLAVTFFCISVQAQKDLTYQKPHKAILDLANAPLTPAVQLDDKGEWMVLLERSAFKSLEEVAQKEERLAGLRINPKTYGPSRVKYYNGIRIKNLKTNKAIKVAGLPNTPLISNTGWSPDHTQFSFTITDGDKIQLWVLDLATGNARKLSDRRLNDTFRGNPYQWYPNSKSMLCKFVQPISSTSLADKVVIPSGPIVMENKGKKAPARTYQDLLKNKEDERKFTSFGNARLAKVELNGKITDIAPAAVYRSYSISPDGNYLMVKRIEQPYSYLVPYYRFPYSVEILNAEGRAVADIYEAPSAEEMPKGFNATSKGPRSISWRNDKPATIYWVEALDEGDPAKKVEWRDALYVSEAPFTKGKQQHIASTKYRFSFVQWSNDNLAVMYDGWWRTRKRTVYQINPTTTGNKSKVLFDLNTEDSYNSPGGFLSTQNEYGKNVLLTGNKGTSLYLRGEGHSPEGNRPFIDEFSIKSGTTKRLWRADGIKTYERIVSVIDITKGLILTSIESQTHNPNYFARNIFSRKKPKQLTDFPNPYEALKGVSKEVIKYKRKDGVDLTATLYLPANYDKERDGRLPMLMWAYPREFKDTKAAGQVKDSPHKFIRIFYGSPLFWVNRGYAVLDKTDFPIIGEGEEEPNDRFIEQLVANAKAAIDAVDQLGVVDPKRVGVGGHSYGAFMTANLLAHSDLFAAGIARSGAYNRTLTPFGFQAEERTFWEAPKLYFKMSPFMHADKVNEPIMLIHGEADNNSGTFPMQSERYYNALKGHGAIARLVMLPFESHGYSARESILHMLWEMDQWLEQHVKNKKS